MQDLTLGVVGATGAVGTEFLKIVESRWSSKGERRLPKLKALASSRSAGRKLMAGGQELVVEETTEESFRDIDIAFISVSTDMSRKFAPMAVAAGATVIDDSSAFRMDDDVPLVVPEVNGADVEDHRGIISIPNCSTTPIVMVCHPLQQVNPVVRIVADTYQSVSGAGGAAMDELREQTGQLLDGQDNVQPDALDHQIGFNVIPRNRPVPGHRLHQRRAEDGAGVPQDYAHPGPARIRYMCPGGRCWSPTARRSTSSLKSRCPRRRRGRFSAPPRGSPCWTTRSTAFTRCPGTWPGPTTFSWAASAATCPIPTVWSCGVVSDNLRKGAALNSIQIAEELAARECLRPRTVASGS